VERHHIPEFKLIHSQPRIKLSGKKQPLKTHSFSVQVLAKDATTMNQFLRKIYAQEHLFMPYTMKKKFPQAVAKAIMKQNKLIQTTWVVVILGISRTMMPALEPIISRKGVIGISDTNRTDKTGRWHILVTEDAFKIIRKTITAKLVTWVNALPENLQADLPPTFPSPQVYQKNGYAGDDDSSSGQDSYMSSCAQSYGSFDDTIADDEYYSPPGRSYASVLSGQDPSNLTERIKEVRIPSKPPANKPSNASIQASEKIASLEAEIKNLRTLLKGAQTPSTVTETSAPDRSAHDAHDDRMTNIENNMALMTTQFSTWMAEMRQNEQSYGSTPHTAVGPFQIMQEPAPSPSSKNDRPLESTPTRESKRTDTRTTPDRRDPSSSAMQVELFPNESTSGLISQPPQIQTATGDLDDVMSPPSSPSGSPDMMAMLRAASSPEYPASYDTDDPMYSYQYNSDGTLFCIGLAQPADFHSDGTIRGPQPTADHSERIRRIFHPSPPRLGPSDGLLNRPPSPEHTLATQDETVMSSATSSPQGQPSTPHPVTGPLLSLLAEGAQLNH
jgi:hypothetical protein